MSTTRNPSFTLGQASPTLRAALATLALAFLASAQSACGSTEEKPDEKPVAAAPPPASEPVIEEEKGFMPPETKMGDVVDEYHGTKIADPYRWLEDPDAPETRTWVEAQNKVSFGYLEKIPFRAELKDRLTALWNYARYSPPFSEGKTTFYFKNDGLQNQSVLYALASPDAEPRVLLDPNTLSEKGTTALADAVFDKEGKLMTYALSSAGSDWRTWKVKNVATGEDLPDEIKWSKFASATFAPDGKGFYYARYPEPTEGEAFSGSNYFHTVYFHKLGTPQSEDVIVVEDKENKERGFEPHVTEDGKFLIVHVWEGTDRRNRLYYVDLTKKGAPIVKLLDAFDAAYEFVGNNGNTFFIKTDNGAQKGKLIAVDIKKPDAKNWKTILPEAEEKLESVRMLNGGFLVVWLKNAHSMVTLHDIKGTKKSEVTLPTLGTVSGFAGKQKDAETYYAFTSFTYPTTIYHLDLKTGVSTEFRKPEVPFDPSAFETEQVWFTSKDGTKLPMFLVSKKGMVKDGENPTHLYAYGGFNISLTPQFSNALIAWLERGGVYAQPSLRGGGEFGEAWHEAGMLEKKQNVFDDFASAARWLVDNKVTKKERLAISGGSNGGLLVGATITQNPDLVAAAVARVGVLDMLRYHTFTIGHAWVSEYGSSANPEQFKTLLAYSPLHNTKAGTSYPATLITTADHDDRVVPAHSYKFVSALQKAHAGKSPVMIRIDVDAGHGAGKPTSKVIEETADIYAFMLSVIGKESAQP
jgi:prolyl oligopeptidase